MDFEWDDRKSEMNEERHGIDFLDPNVTCHVTGSHPAKALERRLTLGRYSSRNNGLRSSARSNVSVSPQPAACPRRPIR